MGFVVAVLAVALIVLALMVLPLRRRIADLERERAERLLREEARLRQMTGNRNGSRNGAPPPQGKRHLRSIRGGAAVAVLLASAAAVRDWWRSHQPLGYTLVAGTAAVTFGAGVYLADDGRGDMGQPPPLTGPSVTALPVETLTPGTPSPSPEDATSRTRPGRSTVPGPSATTLPSPNAPSPNGGDTITTPGPDGDEAEEDSPGDDGDDPEPPGETPPPDDGTPSPTPSQDPGPDSLLCLQVAPTPLLNVDVCLP